MLAYLYVFAPWIILGAVIGLIVAYLPLSASARRGGRAPKGKPARIGLYALAALVGGAASFLAAIQIANAV